MIPADLARLVDGSALLQGTICQAIDLYVEYNPGRRHPSAEGGG
jgi:hypothetical protein